MDFVSVAFYLLRTVTLRNVTIGTHDVKKNVLLGKPVEMFVYPNELQIKNQPKHRFKIYEHNLDWLKVLLREKEDPSPAKAEQYRRWREVRKPQDLISRTSTQNQTKNSNSHLRFCTLFPLFATDNHAP